MKKAPYKSEIKYNQYKIKVKEKYIHTIYRYSTGTGHVKLYRKYKLVRK